MAGNWFANRGQMVQAACAIVSAIFAGISMVVALSVQFPGILKTGLNGISVGWPFVALPVGIVLFWSLVFNLVTPILDRMARRYFEKRFNELSPPVTLPNPPALRAPAALPDAKVEATPFDFEIRDVDVTEIKVNIGAYWEGKVGYDRMRITVLAVVGDPGEQLVDISFKSGGLMFYSGERVKSLGINRFAMPECQSGFQAEEKCVYNYSWSPEHVHFFATRINGIDLHSREVSINFACVRLMKLLKD